MSPIENKLGNNITLISVVLIILIAVIVLIFTKELTTWFLRISNILEGASQISIG
jgi:uncharacterized membrane protein YcaP (DUF421 family)